MNQRVGGSHRQAVAPNNPQKTTVKLNTEDHAVLCAQRPSLRDRWDLLALALLTLALLFVAGFWWAVVRLLFLVVGWS